MKADTVTKDYVKDAGVFADIFNYYIYGGRQEQIIGIEYRLCQIICSGYFMCVGQAMQMIFRLL